MQRKNFMQRLIDLFVGLAEAILLLRIVLRLLNANSGALFVHWVYQTSDTLLAPFRGIFQTEILHQGYVLDFSALFAVLIYAFLGYLLTSLIGILPDGSHHKSK